MYVCVCSVAQSCLTLCDPVGCSLPGSSVQGISQPWRLEWGAISFSRGSSRPRDQTCVSCIGRWVLYHCTTGSPIVSMFRSDQSLSPVQLFVTPWIAARQASLSITNSWSSFRLTSIESVMPSSHLILCRPLLLLPPIPPSIRVFSSESTLLMRWPKYWSFSFRIIPSKGQPGLISFRMDWLDFLEVQGTLKSLLQHQVQKHQFSLYSLLLLWLFYQL